MSKKLVFFIVFIFLAAFVYIGFFYERKPWPHIADFEECARLGGVILETQPRQCIFDGRDHFIEIASSTAGAADDANKADPAVENKKADEDKCAGIAFKDFPVGDNSSASSTIASGSLPELDFSDYPAAREFKTQIIDGLSEALDYAGHYKIVGLNCGTTCQRNTIIDSATGRIIAFGLESGYGLDAKIISRLLIVNPAKNLPAYGSASTVETIYYQLDADSKLAEICRTKASAPISEIGAVKEYVDNEVGFSLKYPASVQLGEQASGTGALILTINKEKIDKLAATMGYDKETAAKDKDELAQGKFGETIDFPLEASKKVFALPGGTAAKEFMVLGRFEVCDVVFERKMIFYRNDYQVVITLRGNRDTIAGSQPEFFQTDEKNCGQMKIWKDQDGFYKQLVAKEGSIPAQLWYDTFTEIEKSIEVK